MNTQPSTTVKVNLPYGIMKNAQKESERIGISLQDFIRMLMGTYFANANAVRSVSHDQMLFDRANEEIKKEKFTRVTSKKELHNYLDSLEN